MCAAPGGKTTHLAQLLFEPSSDSSSSSSLLVAVDRSLAKVRRVQSLCAARGFNNVHCVAADGRYLCAESAASGLAGGPEVEDRDGDVVELAEDDVKAWSSDVENAFQEAVAAHGSDRFRSHKRIYKAVVGIVGRQNVSRLQVQARLRHLAGTSNGADSLVENGGQKVSPPFPPEFFDRILCDVPCSAMGQRPLLRWGKTQAEVVDHAEYQRHFLRTASRLLRPGGTLVYSTCTLTAEENEENVSWALASLPLELEDARAAVFLPESDAANGLAEMAGLGGCGLDDDARQLVLRFDPRTWDVGFFIARFRKR